MISVKDVADVANGIWNGTIESTLQSPVLTPTKYSDNISYIYYAIAVYDPMDKEHLIDLITKGPNPMEE
jgi:hypothetical protein